MDLKNIRIVISGLARNIASHLPKVLEWMRRLREEFHPDSCFVFLTNDSNDNTKEILTNFQAEHAGYTKLYVFDGLAAKIQARTARLAFCRNMVMNHIHANHPTFDLIFLADMDDITVNADAAVIADALRSASAFEWDMIAGMAQPAYYDIWALRSNAIGCNYDCWDIIQHEKYRGASHQDAVKRHVDTWRFSAKPDAAPIPVESAFGGMAFYRLPATRGCTYDGVNKSCPNAAVFPQSLRIGHCIYETCEHVAFHAQMREKNGAKLFIYPALSFSPAF